MNMQPVVAVSAHRLTIKPPVTIGNPILEAFPEEAQRRRFPNSMLQNPPAYLTKTAPKSKDNSSSSRHVSSKYVEFDRSRKPDAKNCCNGAKVDRTLSRLSDESQIPKPVKLSDNLVRSLLIIRYNNISPKDFHSPSVNNRDGTRNMTSGSNPDSTPKKSVASNSNATIKTLLSTSKRKDGYDTENNVPKSKNSNVRNNFSRQEAEYQNGDVHDISATEARLGKNMSNRNDTDINNAKRRFENLEATKSTYNDKEISTEHNLLITQEGSTDTFTRQINGQILVCIFVTDKLLACHQNNSTAAKVSNNPVYMTISEMVAMTSDNINRNSSAIDVRGKSKTLSKKSRRRQGSVYQRNKYLRQLITSSSSTTNRSSSTTTMKTLTEFAIGVRTSTTIKNTSLKNIDKYEVTEAWKNNMIEATTESIQPDVLFNETYNQRNLRENYIDTKNDDLDSKENFFGHEVRKGGKVSNYFNKYLKSHRLTTSKRTAPTTVGTNEIEETQKAASSLSKGMSATAKTDKNDYSSIKTESLLYESNSSKVEIHRYLPAINVADVVDIMSNLSTSNHNSSQQYRDRGNKNCSTSKTRKQSNATFGNFYENNENLQSVDGIDSGLINSNETPESITADDCTYMISKDWQESRETLEEESTDDFDVLILSSTTTRAPEIVTRGANESREKASTERHGKRKHKGRHNGRKNNRKRKKNHDAKRKRKPTSTVAWKVVEPTSVDYGNAYSSERTKTTFSHNDPGYDKADSNRNTSTGGNDWNRSDEITTETFKTEFSNADESVSEDLTEYGIHNGFQSKKTTNVNLAINSTISQSSTASGGKNPKRCKLRVTTTTESDMWSWFTNNNKETDEESTECEEDVTSFPTTSESVEEETGNYSTSTNDDSSTYDEISKSNSISSFWKFFSKESEEMSNKETSTAYNITRDKKNNDKKDTTSKSSLDEESDENNEGIQSWESITHPVTGGTTHDVNSDLDSEEEEDATEKSISGEDNEIDNGVVVTKEDYETDNCKENQHACDKYTCIEEDQVCDGIVDCLNANDETDCDYIYIKRWEEHMRASEEADGVLSSNTVEDTSLDGCSRYEHSCDDMCINALNVCDGERDCLDGTDEDNCTEGILYIKQ